MNQPLIIGAGPVGLGAAMFLARQGCLPRVIEKRDAPATLSKALAVNPRTLTILEPTGLTATMLEMGHKIRGMQFHRGEQVIVRLTLDDIHPKYPFMLALSQASTERLLFDAFTAAGGHVERNVELTACRNVGDHVEAELQSATGRETVAAPWLLAADGAHSTARHQMNVDFPGSSFADEWNLADVVLKTSLADDFGHVIFFDHGAFLFMIRVVDDARTEDPSRPLWRVMVNRPEPLSYLVDAEVVGEPTWSSSFRVSHRINSRLAAGNVYFAGDAAHNHSPMGARGMNLGLEDAHVFDQVEFFSRLVSETAWYSDLVRRYIFPTLLKTPLQSRIKQTVTGLDHELPSPAIGNTNKSRSPSPPQETQATLCATL